MRWAVLLFLPFVSACSRAPDFDARYEDKVADLHNSANAMEREMAQHMADAHAAERNEPASVNKPAR